MNTRLWAVSLVLVVGATIGCGDKEAGGRLLKPGQGIDAGDSDVRFDDAGNLDAHEDGGSHADDIIYVSAARGMDLADGSSGDAPVKTLQRALELAEDGGQQRILLAAGDYIGGVELKKGLSIYGGFSSSFSERDPDEFRTRLSVNADEFNSEKNAYITVLAEDIDTQNATVLSGVSIFGFDARNDSERNGESTIAMLAVESPGLRLEDVQIISGQAGHGARQIHGGVKACEPDRGGAGGARVELSPCQAGSSSGQDRAPSGADASKRDEATRRGLGGKGGRHHCVAGNDGDRPAEIDGANGSRGVHGHDGDPGRLPGEDDIGSFDPRGAWRPALGEQPTPGENGGGGGGGGAGGNLEFEASDQGRLRGGEGGRGMDGACGGEAGKNGGPGGAAFGLVVVGQAISIEQTSIKLGVGGEGGNGGMGGEGSKVSASIGNPGEDGEQASSQDPSAGRGGSGGAGGSGGDGGSGVGGRGGHSIGLLTTPDMPQDITGVQFNVENAAAGQGGANARLAGVYDGPVSNAPEGIVVEHHELY